MTAPSAITRASRCRGCDPIASRMPNSRVRALTENASTPATPTTAMVSATMAKPPKTMVFKRSGVSTSARTSSRVAARSTGWSTERSRMVRVIGRDQGVRIRSNVDEEAAAKQRSLPERLIHRQGRAGNQVLVVDIRGDCR